jgi:hypothetical protein
VLAIGLSGCNTSDTVVDIPIQAYRSVTGVNKNDPDPATTPYTENLTTADAQPYPNLASVPPPPNVASTVAERTQLATALSTQRSSTQASDTHGPGSPTTGPVPPPPAIPASIAAPEMANIPPATPKPETPVPPLRAMDEPPLPTPPNSMLQTPQISSLPGVEKTRPSPAQGQPSAMPAPGSSALPPAAVASGNPQPAPPLATLPEPKPSPQAAAMPPPKLPPKGLVVASLDLAPGTAAIAAGERSRIAQVVAQYNEKPRTVRVVAYAAPGVGSAEQLNAFRTALDRAEVVAKELRDAGIPAAKIQTEAAPESASAPAGRIEVQLLQ